MPTSQDARLVWYQALQQEAKFRISWIEYALNGHSGLDSELVREFCFLQLRMNCEIVALGCLLAHGDIPATQSARFQNAGIANDILKGLEKLKPDFYPKPLLETSRGPQGERRFIPRALSDTLTKTRLLSLYNRTCGTALHKGSLKNLPKRKVNDKAEYGDIIEIAQRMVNLLSLHRIGLHDDQAQLVCLWTETGRVQVVMSEGRL